MKVISVSLPLLTLVSSIVIITLEESNATSKAEEKEEEAEDKIIKCMFYKLEYHKYSLISLKIYD